MNIIPTRKQSEEALGPAINDINFVQGYGVSHFFAFLKFAYENP